jgi:hypothetical protein
MEFNELTSGGVRSGGCTITDTYRTIETQFGIGNTLYYVAKARRGKLEKIVIKGVRIVASRRTYGATRVLYQDTFNGLWNEHDLVSYEKAVELIQGYHATLEADRNRLPSC